MFSPSSPVAYARFRPVDFSKDADILPSSKWYMKLFGTLGKLIMKVICTAKVYFGNADILNFVKPYPFELLDRVSGWLGWSPEKRFISEFHTFLGENFILKDPVVITEFFKKFRGSFTENDFFEPARSIRATVAVFQEAFPNSNMKEEDIIFSCSKAKNKQFRNWLIHLMGPKIYQNYRASIKQTVKSTLEEWSRHCAAGGDIPITQAGLFASQVITNLMFGSSVEGDQLGDAVNFINKYIFLRQFRRITPEDTTKYLESLQTFRDAVEEVLNRPDAPIFADQNGKTLSLAEKRAMAFTVFFAGQETTGFLLGYILVYLAKHPEVQHSIRCQRTIDHQDSTPTINSIITHALLHYPPSYGVVRQVNSREDVCLVYRFEGEEQKRKVIFPKGCSISARMIDAAQRVFTSAPNKLHEADPFDAWSAFGSGAHSCPGKHIALLEIREFLSSLLQNYEVSTEYEGQPRVAGRVTLQFVDDIRIRLKEISSH